jgi:methionine synthase II (cobalamin-independent)
VVIHPDCGLRALPLESVQSKLRVMTAAARRFT